MFSVSLCDKHYYFVVIVAFSPDLCWFWEAPGLIPESQVYLG